MSRTPEPGAPLDREEQELAALLARDVPGDGPSPALDAAILAAARVAVTKPAAAPPRAVRRPRLAWAAGAGLAASVVLAVGVAWQVRPQGDAFEINDEAPPVMAQRSSGALQAEPAPVPDADAAHADRADGAAPAPAVMSTAPPAPYEPLPSEPAAPAMAASGTPTDAAPAPAPPAPPAESPPVVFDEPAAAAAIRASDGLAEAARRNRVDDQTADAAQRRAAPKTSPVAPAPTAVPQVDDFSGFDQPLDDAPPASADAPEVRDAWLARIRELVAEERYAEADASFDEFRRRYPDVAVPRDLRVLLP